jgi:hypothetical protein
MSDASRRKLLKSIATGSGAIVAGKSLPESWSKPIVDSVVLPAHAKTSDHLVGGTKWYAYGELSVAGAVGFAADCLLIITDVVGIGGVAFTASGADFIVGGFIAEVTGKFVVDPATVGGKCHYHITVGAVEEGEAIMTLKSKDKTTLYGTFKGLAEGLAAGDISGTGHLLSTE